MPELIDCLENAGLLKRKRKLKKIFKGQLSTYQPKTYGSQKITEIGIQGFDNLGKNDGLQEGKKAELGPYFFSPTQKSVVSYVFNLDRKREDLLNGIGKLKFGETIAYVYPFGLGILAIEVKVEADEGKTFIEISENVETKVKEEIKKIFDEKIKKLAVDLFNAGDKNLASTFGFGSRIGESPWEHLIYWLQVDGGVIEEIQRNDHSNLAELPDRIAGPSSDLEDKYVMYGWAKSFILSSKDAKCSEEWVEDKVNYLRSVQYVYCGLSLLDSTLSKKRMESETDDLGDITTEAQRRALKFQIKDFRTLKRDGTNYLESFRYDMNELKRKEFILYNSVLANWRLEEHEKAVRDNLKFIDEELSAKKQSLITTKQDQLNKIAVIFAVVSIVGVIGAFVELHPLKGFFLLHNNTSLNAVITRPLTIFTIEVFVAAVVSGVVVFVILFVIMKSRGMIEEIRDRLGE